MCLLLWMHALVIGISDEHLSISHDGGCRIVQAENKVVGYKSYLALCPSSIFFSDV